MSTDLGGRTGWLRVAAALGALAVTLGAFGAHGLEQRVPPDLLETWEIGVRYHFYHALALLALVFAPGALWRSRWLRAALWSFVAGITIFSGTLYLLVLTGERWLGAVTPIGGVLLIVGWTLLIPAAGRLRDHVPAREDFAAHRNNEH